MGNGDKDVNSSSSVRDSPAQPRKTRPILTSTVSLGNTLAIKTAHKMSRSHHQQYGSGQSHSSRKSSTHPRESCVLGYPGS